MEKLAAGGIANGIIDAGGDLRLSGSRPGKGFWRVGVQHPRDTGALLFTLDLTDTAIVTSGDYERSFEERGLRYHHILDPATRVQLVGRSLAELLPDYVPGDDPAHAVDVTFVRPDSTRAVLELRRQSVSFAGRACWLTAGHDVTAERAERATQDAHALRALALDESPLGACLVDEAGQLRYANAPFLDLLELEPGQVTGASLHQFEHDDDADSTIRRAALARDGRAAYETRWRRADGSLVDVEISSGAAGAIPGGMRVVICARHIGSAPQCRACRARTAAHRRPAGPDAARAFACGVRDPRSRARVAG